MSTNGWMDKENVIHTYTHNGILSSFKKEENLDICDNKDESRGQYAKGNKLDRERNNPWSQLYVKSKTKPKKKIKLIDTENRLVVARKGEGEMGNGLNRWRGAKGYKLPVIKCYGDVIYSMVTIVNIILHIWKLLRE